MARYITSSAATLAFVVNHATATPATMRQSPITAAIVPDTVPSAIGRLHLSGCCRSLFRSDQSFNTYTALATRLKERNDPTACSALVPFISFPAKTNGANTKPFFNHWRTRSRRTHPPRALAEALVVLWARGAVAEEGRAIIVLILEGRYLKTNGRRGRRRVAMREPSTEMRD